MKKIEANWKSYNQTQKGIFNYLFLVQQGTVDELAGYTSINQNTVRTYLNGFIDDGILVRNSKKQRDKDAPYSFRKD